MAERVGVVSLLGQGGSQLNLFARFSGAVSRNFEAVVHPQTPRTPLTHATDDRHAAVAVPWIAFAAVCIFFNSWRLGWDGAVEFCSLHAKRRSL